MITTLARLFTLRPYGKNLLDGVAESWMLLAAVTIASIAFCDAVAWGYFGYTTATGATAYVVAAIAGFVVLALVGSVDAMFVMHDRSAAEERAPVSNDARRGLLSKIRRGHIAIAARIVLVILTFTVTAPFLTQLFFSRDIEANIRRANEQRVATRRQQLVESYDARLAALRTQLAARQGNLEREIAGSGASGRYGSGPTARAIAADVAALQRDIAATADAKQAEVAAFDAATPEVLASRYGVDLVREGPATRARVVAELQQSPSFVATQRTIKAFLVFMFLGLVCLKLFQPQSVHIYYSSRLQAAYARYKAGVFNQRLDPREFPDAAGMTPVRFAEWFENDQRVRDETERLREHAALAVESMRTQEEAIMILHASAREDIARVERELATLSQEREEFERQLTISRAELSAAEAKIAEDQRQLDEFNYDTGELPLRDQQLLVASRARTARQLAERRASLATLSANVAALTSRLQSSSAREQQLRATLLAAGAQVEGLGAALHRVRDKRAADILAAGQSS